MVKAERPGGCLENVRGFIGGRYGPDLHAKRIDAWAGATLGVMIRAVGPDAVLIACSSEDGLSLMKQYRELQMKPVVMGLGVIWSSPNS